MTRPRKEYSPAVQLSLTTQVQGRCPLCGEKLFHRKRKSDYKSYDLAHIYPLNPTVEELAELAGVRRLSEDPNDPDNIVPLCKLCHGRYDKPRTRQEYEDLLRIKVDALQRMHQLDLQVEYPIEAEIAAVISGLYSAIEVSEAPDIEYALKNIDEKFNDTLPTPTRLKIRSFVREYYGHVRSELLRLEHDSPTSSELISSQVKAFYLKQRSLGLTQGQIFANIVLWLMSKTTEDTVEGAEVVASYFVQSCEVFE